MKRNFKRLVVISDMHCGHAVGLTPPNWQYPADPETHRGKIGLMQKTMWDWYAKEIKQLKPIDIIVCNGDAIDGKGDRSGGTEQITTDREQQVEMSAQCIKLAEAKKILLIYGTAYHTGALEDWEQNLFHAVRAEKIGSHEWVDINGFIFDFKHHIGNSSIPHGRFTQLAKDKLWNDEWYLKEKRQPNSDVIVRSHVHEFREVRTTGWRALTTPALQGYGSKFGARRCSGLIEIGFVYFDVFKDGISCNVIGLQSDILQANVLQW